MKPPKTPTPNLSIYICYLKERKKERKKERQTPETMENVYMYVDFIQHTCTFYLSSMQYLKTDLNVRKVWIIQEVLMMIIVHPPNSLLTSNLTIYFISSDICFPTFLIGPSPLIDPAVPQELDTPGLPYLACIHSSEVARISTY